MIVIRDMTFRIAGRVLFDEASATIPDGHKVGLVGRNGTGKSTLLKLLTEEYQADSGSLSVSGVGEDKAGIGMVAQEAPAGAATPLETVLAADQDRASLMAEREVAEDPLRIAEIETRLADIGAHAAPSRAARILSGLGFSAEMQEQPLSSFSGGWRMRVSIAAMLFAEPELLLLDEPTNHLDIEATMWLEAHLQRYPKTMIIVSHDRDLLNKAVDGILHLEGGKLTYYTGAYDRFERTREEKLALLEAQRTKQEAQRKHMQAFIDRFRYKASKARQAQSRIKALERMGSLPPAVSEPTTVFRFPEPEEMPPPLVTFDKASVGYAPGKPVLSNLSLRLDADDRIGLLGQNGNGKSTLAKLIAGRLQTMAGNGHRAAKLRIGFFAQHQVEDLVPEDTAAEHMARLMPGQPPDRVRARLGNVGLVQDKQTTKVKHLSGGEKARLTIALVTHDRPHVLILDEPTNHLDIDARDALVQALNDYKGAVILISHDRRLVELTMDRLWLVANGTVRPFDEDMDAYRKWVRDQRSAGSEKAADKQSQDAPAAENSREGRKDARKAAAERRQQMASVRKAAKDAEKRLDKLSKDRESLMATMADPSTWEKSTAEVQKLALKKAALDKEIADVEERWLAAEAELEAAG